MRYLIVVTLAFVGALAGTTAQTEQSEMSVTIRPSGGPGGSAGVIVRNEQIYIGGNAAFVGVPGQESNPAAVRFCVRAWKEGLKARVVVYAVLKDDRAPGGNTETPIATFLVAAGEAIDVPQAEPWGGKRLTVSAEVR